MHNYTMINFEGLVDGKVGVGHVKKELGVVVEENPLECCEQLVGNSCDVHRMNHNATTD